MKISNYVIVFLSIALCFASVIFINIDITTTINRQNTEYSKILANACYDAAHTMNSGNIDQYGCVWKDSKDIDKTLDIFFTSLAYSFFDVKEPAKDEMSLYSPVVCLVDMDGFYISYNVSFDDTISLVSDNPNDKKLYGVTPINTWSKTYGTVLVRFYLSDDVELYTNSGITYYGNREDVYNEITAESFATSVEFLKDKDSFNDEKNSVIVQKINNQCQYYINNHNMLGDRYEAKYVFSMPELAGDDWARVVQTPTILAFLQGYSTNTDKKLLNVYSLGGGELVRNYHYFVITEGGNKYMHCLESELGKKVSIDDVDGKYKYEISAGNKIEIPQFYDTQALCLRDNHDAIVHKCIYDMNF